MMLCNGGTNFSTTSVCTMKKLSRLTDCVWASTSDTMAETFGSFYNYRMEWQYESPSRGHSMIIPFLKAECRASFN